MKVTTETSVYEFTIEEGQQFMTRLPQEWEVPEGVYRNVLRRDGERMKVVSLEPVEVGRPMIMMIDLRQDGVLTLRRTTLVTKVE